MLCLGEELLCGGWERASHQQSVRRAAKHGAPDWRASEAQWSSGQSSQDAEPLPTPLHPSPALWLSWFHLANMERGGHGVIPWPHQISPNRVRCLARVKTSNLKGIKCKCDDHMPTSNTDSSHPAVLPLLPPHIHTAEPFTCLTGWGAVKMTMGFCHADQVQNISTAGQILSCLISVNRTFATKNLQLNYSLPLRIDISYIYVLCASISLFILTLNLEYGNKGVDA